MGNPVFFFRGIPTPPGPDWLNRTTIADAVKMLDLSDESWKRVVDGLVRTDSFLGDADLVNAIASANLEQGQVEPLERLLGLVLDPPFSVPGDSVSFFMNSLRSWQRKNAKTESQPALLSPEQAQQICDRLSLLSGNLPALVRQKKAKSLQATTGQLLESFELICDLRPIFDSSREEIEGVIPVTHLKLVAETVAGLPTAFEVVLSESNVRSLHKATANAIKKLTSLRRFAAKAELPIPEIGLTNIGDDDA